MVSIAAEWLRHDPVELCLDLIDIFSRRESRSVADTEDMRVDGERLLSKRRVENDVGRLAAYSRKFLELFPRPRNFTAVLVDQRLAECDDILRFGVEQSDGLDRFAQLFFAKIQHLPRRFHLFEQGLGRDIYAGVGRLRREHDRDEQLVRVSRFELGRRGGIFLRQPSKKFEYRGAIHSASITSRME